MHARVCVYHVHIYMLHNIGFMQKVHCTCQTILKIIYFHSG